MLDIVVVLSAVVLLRAPCSPVWCGVGVACPSWWLTPITNNLNLSQKCAGRQCSHVRFYHAEFLPVVPCVIDDSEARCLGREVRDSAEVGGIIKVKVENNIYFFPQFRK